MQKTISIILLLMITAAVGYLAYSEYQKRQLVADVADYLAEESPPTQSDSAASDPVRVAFKLGGLDGDTRDFSEWDGKHRIVNFWATWCAPCRREIPLLKAFQEQQGENDFQVIGIAVEFLEPVIAYAAEADFNYPILVGEQDAMAVAESSGISFIGLPFTMVVARDGTLIGAHMGEIHQQHLDQIVVVMKRLDAGEIDITAAKSALKLM